MIEFCLNSAPTVIPYFDQYMGFWAMNEPEFRGLAERASSTDIKLHVQKQMREQQDDVPRELQVQNGVAMIELHGTLMKHVSSFSRGTSTLLARADIGRAIRNKEVEAIMLHIDSPGGTVAGTGDLAAAVARADMKKPVFAFIEDLGASAAFWVASQARKVFTNSSAMIGSIGTFGVVHDMSVMAAREGVKVHVIKAGKFKGAGVPGTEVTADQLMEQQRVVDDLNEEFVRGVATGRKMSMEAVREIADGRVHVGKSAQKLGFSDGVKTFDQAFSLLVSETKPKRRNSMSDNSFELLKAACVGADNDFLCDQMARQNTIDQAREDWMIEQQLRLEERDKELEASIIRERESHKQSTVATTVASTGVDPLEDTVVATAAMDATSEWNALLQKKKDRGIPPSRATSELNRTHKDLRRRMVEEANGRPVELY